MKAMKKVLALGLALAMVVTAVPVTSAQAETAKLTAGKTVSKTYYAGKTHTFKLSGVTASNVKKTTWSKNGSAAVTLSSKAKTSVKVKAVKAGTAKVTATVKLKSGKTKKYTCKITVKTPSVKLTPATAVVKAGATTTLKTTKKPASSTVSYTSDKPEVATVDAKGVVTGVADGEATITATLKCGTTTKKASTVVTVYEDLDIASAEPSKSGSNIVVTFTTPVKSVDFKDFYLGGDVLVENATLSEDGKTAVLTLNKKLTSTVEYTLDALNLTPVNGDAKEKLSTKIKWIYTDGASVETDALAKIGEATGIRVIDAKGQEVSVVKSMQIITSNSSVVALDGTTANINAAVAGTLANVADIKLKAVSAGTATVTVKTVLVDGTTLTEVFAYTIADATVEKVTCTLYGAANEYGLVPTTAPANAKAAASVANTTMRWNSTTAPSAYVAYYNTTNGNPDIEKVALTTTTVKSVESLNKTVATAAVDATGLKVTASANVDATANFRVTMMDGTYWTFQVTIEKAPELTKLVVNKTALSLSDEDAVNLGIAPVNGYVAGVNQDTVTVSFKDQYDKAYTIDSTFTGKLVISTNSVAGIEIAGDDANDSCVTAVDGSSIEYSATALNSKSSVTYTVNAKKDQTAQPTITAKLFETAASATAKTSVSTAVTVVNIDGNADATAVKSFKGVDDATICANACIGCADSIDYTAGTYYLLDAKGNTLAKVDSSKVEAVNNNDPDGDGKTLTTDWVGVTTNEIAFDTDAKDYYSGTTTTEVLVKVPTDGKTAVASDNFLSKVVKVTAINHRSVPHAATVTSSNVTIKDCDQVLTLADLIFGVIDDSQMVIDDTTKTGNTIGIGGAADGYIAVSSTAKNNGYKYNTPVVSILNDQNKAVSFGAQVYGLSAAETDGAMTWAITGAGEADTNGTFDINATVVSISGNAASKVDATGLKNALSAGETVSFTVLINSIYTANDDNAHKDANLLSGVQSVTFTISR